MGHKVGKMFPYKHVTHCKTFKVDKEADSIINESTDIPRRSMKRKGTHRRVPDVILGQTGGRKTAVASWLIASWISPARLLAMLLRLTAWMSWPERELRNSKRTVHCCWQIWAVDGLASAALITVSHIVPAPFDAVDAEDVKILSQNKKADATSCSS